MPIITPNSHKSIAIWLLICAAMILMMIFLGGVTRLTGSGLSMVDWKPIMGILPPLSNEEWLQSFQLYQQFPEFQQHNSSFTLGDYQSIFWLEYFHRLLGRTIGLVFFIPFLLFLFLGKIDSGLKPRLWLMFVLGGMQGLLGWFMVKSGLVDNPHVSQYRLVAHLLLAIVIYAYIVWVAVGLLFPKRADQVGRRFRVVSILLCGLSLLVIISGGFVAGLKAGLIFNTFPLMGDQWVPDGLLALQPVWRNMFENLILVQFNHRLIAITLLCLVCGFWLYSTRQVLTKGLRILVNLLLIAILIQVSLGISTLLLKVPVPLAAMHQAGALCVITLLLLITRRVN